MKYPGYDTGKVVLSEGKWYSFRIHNLIQLQDGNWYHVLQDLNGLKHFLPAGYYTNYSLNTGEEIDCRIDKINCTGRIFLEPKHPVYKEGEIYEFKVFSFEIKDDSVVLFVEDIYGNSIEVQQYGIPENSVEVPKKVMCIVKNIKKSIPDLAFYDNCF